MFRFQISRRKRRLNQAHPDLAPIGPKGRVGGYRRTRREFPDRPTGRGIHWKGRQKLSLERSSTDGLFPGTGTLRHFTGVARTSELAEYAAMFGREKFFVEPD